MKLNQKIDRIRNQHTNIFRVLLTVVAGILILWINPTQVSFKYEFYIGSPWQNEDLLSPFDFAILKTNAELDNEKNNVRKSIVPIYYRDREKEKKSIELFESLWEHEWPEIAKDSSCLFFGDDIKQDALREIKEVYDIGIISIDDVKGRPANNEYIFLKDDKNGEDRLVSDFLNLKESLSEFQINLTDTVHTDPLKLFNLISQIIEYNILFDESKTDLLLNEELKNISPFKGKIEKGTMIIQRGEVVTPMKNQELLSLKEQYESKAGANLDVWLLVFGEAIFLLIIFSLSFRYIVRYNKEIIMNPSGWSFILFFYVLAVLMFKLGVYDNHFNQFLFPILIIPIIIKAFFDIRLALVIHIMTVFLVSGLVPNPYEFITIQILAGFIVLFSLGEMRKRAQFFITAIIIFLSYSIIYLSFAVLQAGSLAKIDWMQFAWLFGNGLLSLLAFPLIYLFERMFGFLSDMTLIEMTDMNSRLLRLLAEKAPGTFQHSMQVANLAEEAIRAVGGNELLVRVGALYHDIGKAKNPMYFIENQTSGMNPHNELSYTESASIIIQHVIDGIDMARKSKIPEPIIDFIRTHHGTTRVEYFYRNYKKEHPDEIIDESVFTYPGPKPYSKETAVLMMADGVEAATRSIKKYDKESIENLVEAMIDNSIKSGQFENANITFLDIKRIKKIFKKMLLNIYHVRIEYPK